MFRSRCCLLLLASFVAAPFSISAAILGELNVIGFGLLIGRGGLQPEVSLSFGLSVDTPGSPCFNPSLSCIVLLDQVLTPSDVGTIFRFTNSSPGFVSAAHFLTDGIDDEWSFFRSGSGGGVG